MWQGVQQRPVLFALWAFWCGKACADCSLGAASAPCFIPLRPDLLGTEPKGAGLVLEEQQGRCSGGSVQLLGASSKCSSSGNAKLF